MGHLKAEKQTGWTREGSNILRQFLIFVLLLRILQLLLQRLLLLV
jgi:hypothetical protein